MQDAPTRPPTQVQDPRCNIQGHPPARQPGRLPHKSGRLTKSAFVEQASRLLGGWRFCHTVCLRRIRRSNAQDDEQHRLETRCEMKNRNWMRVRGWGRAALYLEPCALHLLGGWVGGYDFRWQTNRARALSSPFGPSMDSAFPVSCCSSSSRRWRARSRPYSVT